MKNIIRFSYKAISVFAAISILYGCGDGGYTGAYRHEAASSNKTMILNIHGDEAEIIGEDKTTGRITPLVKMKVSVKDGKLLLDDVNGTERLAFMRNVDEQSLDCLNCKLLGLKDDALWKYDHQGPYNVKNILEDQVRKDEEALNAELTKMQERIFEQARRDEEAPKLAPYEGEWVYQRLTKQDPLKIMTIWTKSHIKSWSFRFETLARLAHEVPGFEVTDEGLKIGVDADSRLYSLSPDKKTLTCTNCSSPERWVKADPQKDLTDREYARQMAGNP